MHTRYLRPVEHARTAPRRVLSIFQQDPASSAVETKSSRPVAANQVLTGFIYQHPSFGAGANTIGLGINTNPINATSATVPALETLLSTPYGQGVSGDRWLQHDKNMQTKLPRQSSPLFNAAGYIVAITQGQTFNGMHSIATVRNPVAADFAAPKPTRFPRPNDDATIASPPSWSWRFFYGTGTRPPRFGSATYTPGGPKPQTVPLRTGDPPPLLMGKAGGSQTAHTTATGPGFAATFRSGQ